MATVTNAVSITVNLKDKRKGTYATEAKEAILEFMLDRCAAGISPEVAMEETQRRFGQLIAPSADTLKKWLEESEFEISAIPTMTRIGQIEEYLAAIREQFTDATYKAQVTAQQLQDEMEALYAKLEKPKRLSFEELVQETSKAIKADNKKPKGKGQEAA